MKPLKMFYVALTKPMNAKQVKTFFIIVLSAAILGALSSCSNPRSRSGQKAEEIKTIKFDDAQALLQARIMIRVGDTSQLFSPIRGTDRSYLYKNKIYRYDKREKYYVLVRY